VRLNDRGLELFAATLRARSRLDELTILRRRNCLSPGLTKA